MATRKPLLLGTALNSINSSLIATALPNIATGINVSIVRTNLLVSILYLTSAIAQPTLGSLAEYFGPRRILIIGGISALIGGIIGGLGHVLWQLLLARILIGIGTSAGYPSAMVMIDRRARKYKIGGVPGNVLGALQVAAMATATVGLPIGGIIVSTFGWRSVFLINVPFVCLMLVTAMIWLESDRHIEKLRLGQLARSLDLIGIVLFAATIALWLFFLFTLPKFSLWLMVGAIFATISMTFREYRVIQPFFDIRYLIHNRHILNTLFRMLLLQLCIYVVMYGFSQWLEVARGFNPDVTGLLMLPMSAVSALIIPPLSSRNIVKPSLLVAGIASLLGAIGMYFVNNDTSILWVVILTVVFGIAMGTTSQGNQTALYSQVPTKTLGLASGLLKTFAYFGSIGSTLVVKAGFTSGINDAGITKMATIIIVVSLIDLLFTIFDKRIKRYA